MELECHFAREFLSCKKVIMLYSKKLLKGHHIFVAKVAFLASTISFPICRLKYQHFLLLSLPEWDSCILVHVTFYFKYQNDMQMLTKILCE